MKMKVGHLYPKFKSNWEKIWVPTILQYWASIEKDATRQIEDINGNFVLFLNYQVGYLTFIFSCRI